MESKNYQNNLTNTMTKAQREAVIYGCGPLLVIAGPGSGKTFVITHRIRHMIEHLYVNPLSILVVTFSREAARQMKNRYSKIDNINSSKITFATIHAFCFSILKKAYGYDEESVSRGDINFDEMLSKTYELLSQRDDILSLCRQRYRWILVDEFQDVSKDQYDILRLLAGDRGNITVVGDDDQSIYAFRGAMPSIMNDFLKDNPSAAKICLDTNFRSTSRITNLSRKLIFHNKDRQQKIITSQRDIGCKIKIDIYNDRRSECEYIARDIANHIRNGTRKEDIAILYRTNFQSRLIIKNLDNLHIGYHTKDHISDIMTSEVSKDIFSYMLASYNIATRNDLLRIINRPYRSIDRRDLISQGANIDNLTSKSAMKLKKDLSAIWHFHDISLAIDYIRKHIGYDIYLKEQSIKNKTDLESDIEILEELSESSKGLDDPNEWIERLRLDTSYTYRSDDGIRLMTFHASKGLEYDIVYIIDANEGITPYKKAITDEEIEEERRQFYVAMTRAKNMLHICATRHRGGKNIAYSRFIRECIG